jgi:hypothetical protein
MKTYSITSPGESESVLATAPIRFPMRSTEAVLRTSAGHQANSDGRRSAINSITGMTCIRSMTALVESRSISSRPGVTGSVR